MQAEAAFYLVRRFFWTIEPSPAGDVGWDDSVILLDLVGLTG